MKRIKKILTVLLACSAMTVHPSPSYSQGITEGLRLHTAFNGGEFATASPAVASMLRYGDCQMDLFHGRMGLQLPLYEYTDRDFTIPFVLGYSTQGYQPGLDTGVCGLGWTLNCGGCITREVRGIPDDAVSQTRTWKRKGGVSAEDFGFSAGGTSDDLSYELREMSSVNIEGYYSLWAMSPEDYAGVTSLDCYYDGALNHDYEYYWRNPQSAFTLQQGYETQSDIYHFSFLGISGDFVLQPCGGFAVYNCDIPSGCVSIEWRWNAGAVHSGSVFVIRTGDGMSYEFSKVEDCFCYDTVNGGMGDERTNTSWLLTRVTAPNGRYVQFNYSEYNYGSSSYSTSICVDRLRTKGKDNHWNNTWENADDSGQNAAYVNTTQHTTVNVSDWYRLESVEVPSLMRAELSYDDSGRLGSLIVKNNQGRTVKSVSMEYSSVGVSLLKAVSIGGQGRWSFSYWSEDEEFPLQTTWKTDNLGFYNGSDVYKYLAVPQFIIGVHVLEDYAASILRQRSPSLSHCRMGALKEIVWPAGGRSVINYGLNTYVNGEVEVSSYGIRPEVMETYDDDGALLQRKTYSYTDEAGRCSGHLLLKPQIYYRYYIWSTTLETQREAVSTQSRIGLGPQAFQEYSCVIERVQGADPSMGVAQTAHRFITSEVDGLSALTEYYTSASGEPALGDGTWEYGYSNGWVPDDRQMMGESYLTGRETYTLSRDVSADRTVSSCSRTYTSSSVGAGLISFPAMLSNRPCFHVINPCHVFLSGQRDSVWCSNGAHWTDTRYGIDEFCRPVVTSTSNQGETARGIYTSYLEPGSLLPTGQTVRSHEEEVSSEKVEYVNRGTEDAPWYLPSAQYRLDYGDGEWKVVNRVLSYDDDGNPAAIEDAMGGVTELEWAADGLHLTKRTVHPSDSDSLQTRWTWIPLVGMSSRVDPSGKVTEWTYDRHGRLIRTKVCGVTTDEAAYNISTESNNE